MGMKVHVLFTYGGFKQLKRGHTDDIGEETDTDVRSLIKNGLEKGGVPPISRQIKEAKRMVLKVYACIDAMASFYVTKDELIGEVDKLTGSGTFLELMKNATITLPV